MCLFSRHVHASIKIRRKGTAFFSIMQIIFKNKDEKSQCFYKNKDEYTHISAKNIEELR